MEHAWHWSDVAITILEHGKSHACLCCAQLAEAEARLGAQQALFDGARAEASRNRQNLLAAQDELAQLRTRIRGLVRCCPCVSSSQIRTHDAQDEPQLAALLGCMYVILFTSIWRADAEGNLATALGSKGQVLTQTVLPHAHL